MRKGLLIILFIISTKLVISQSVEKSLFKIDLLAPGVSYEHKLTQKSTLLINAHMGFAFGRYGGFSYYTLIPEIVIENRYYHNFERRNRKGKNTKNNSGNFLAPLAALSFPSALSNFKDNSRFAISVGGIYGLQRTYKPGIYTSLEGGVALRLNDMYAFPVFMFTIGYTFKNKEKENSGNYL